MASVSPSLVFADHTQEIRRCTVAVEGVVQGVGFRPFVYRLARSCALAGSVRNDGRGVLIEVEGNPDAVQRFLHRLVSEAPAAARPTRVMVTWGPPRHEGTAFHIDASQREGRPALFPAPDLAVCPGCVGELADARDRRYRYPFLNCTGCGPRFTIIRGLPYDRERTMMAGFAMCRQCQAEYRDPADRRFHAEPTACPACGPRLAFEDTSGLVPSGAPLTAAAAVLRSGGILAVKGLGGYHLACDATSRAAVAELRRRKGRNAKPFAIMARTLAEVERLCVVSPAECRLLGSAAAPIVLLEKRAAVIGPAPVDEVAPGLHELGIMLPYTPLHHLLLEAVGVPLVMTSGNLSDEPIAHDDDDARSRLGVVADAFLLHDRPIQIRCDDSIARVIRGAPMLLRRARGYVPLAIPLPRGSDQPILAVGGELKNVFGLVRERDVFLSPHLGDLTDERTWRAWRAMVEHLERLLELVPTVVAHDMHPGYRSAVYAMGLDGVERVAVQHHHAHIASCLADNGVDTPVIGVAWDGTGYGADGTVWGGEFLVADLAGFERVGHLEPVPMPGGEAAIREPWRMAAALLRAAYGETMHELDLDFVQRLNRPAWRMLTAAIEDGLNAPLTSSAGRLFDAVASLLGIRDTVEFEAQAAMELEACAAASEPDQAYAIGLTVSGASFVVRTTDLIRAMVNDLLSGVARAQIAARFHASLAEVMASACARIRAQTNLDRVALSGGVFQNAHLLGAALARLEALGFEVYTHRHVPPNDGGLALGQAAVAAARVGASAS
jgi:hydrogenase maturation protein HypF